MKLQIAGKETHIHEKMCHSKDMKLSLDCLLQIFLKLFLSKILYQTENNTRGKTMNKY
mgnify:CR=1 FL=1